MKARNTEFFHGLLLWYYRKDVVPTLEAIQKLITFYHGKDIDLLEVGCALPNLVKVCKHNFTDAKSYPLTEADKDLNRKVREVVVGVTFIIFKRTAGVDETFFRKPTNRCKSIVRIDAGPI